MSRRGRVKTHLEPQRSAFLSVPRGGDMAKSRRFSKSKSVCAGWSGKVPRLCAIWTPQCGGMKGSCVLSSAKVRILFRTIEVFARKTFRFLRIVRDRIKTCGLSFETPLLFSSSSPLFWKRRPSLRPLFSHPHRLTRERTRPCASRTQRVRNSCLHPSPSPAIH